MIAADEATPPADFFRDLEARRLRSLVDRDMDLARSLHADDYQLITPGGATYTKAEYLDAIESRKLNYEVFEADSDVAVRVFQGAAAVRYVARIKISWDGGHDDTRAWHTDIYERREAGWQAIWSHATAARRAPD